MTPTVGRIVHYWPDHREKHIAMMTPKQPLAAIIVGVRGDGTLNLACFDAFGDHMTKSSVPLLEEGAAPPSGQYCEWPARG